MRAKDSGRPSSKRFESPFPKLDFCAICSKIFVRAYAEPKKRRPKHPAKPQERPASWFDGRFLVLDTETVLHKLTFGAFEFWDGQAPYR